MTRIPGRGGYRIGGLQYSYGFVDVERAGRLRLRFSGTQGPFQGTEPTGRSVEFRAIRIYRLVDALVVETWAHQDSMGLVRQLRG